MAVNRNVIRVRNRVGGPINMLAPHNVLCVVMAELGHSYDFISRRTQLTMGQVAYRIQKAGAQVRLYRNGENRASRLARTELGPEIAIAVRNNVD